MESYWIAVLIAFIVSGAATCLLATTRTSRFLDIPNERSLHTSPKPRTGGLAIYLGFVGSLLAMALVGNFKDIWTAQSIWIIGGITLIACVSWLDDRIGVPAVLRFGVHALASIIVVFGAGLRISEISIPSLGTINLAVLAAPLTVLGIVWMTNLYNFMDGMDGFAGGMAVSGFGFIAFVAVQGARLDIAVF